MYNGVPLAIGPPFPIFTIPIEVLSVKPKKIPPAPSLLKILPTPCPSLFGYLNPLAVKGACIFA